MSAPGPPFAVKGWCPGALHPMESGDGLIVRIRPHNATLTRDQLLGIAAAAQSYGNGHIDLTRRANLQIRGVAPEALAPLQCALGGFGLVDQTAEAERVRNILVSPLSGIDPHEIVDMRPLASQLAQWLAGEPAAWKMPAKFGLVLDGGGQLMLSGERADIRANACVINGRPMVVIARDAKWLGMVEPEYAFTALASIIAGETLKLQCVETLNVQNENFKATFPGIMQLDAGFSVVGLGVPFGRLEVSALHDLAEITAEVRLSPWRMVFIPLTDSAARRAAAVARKVGFVTQADDPRMRIQACPGRPACRAAHADTRADAEHIVHWMAAKRFRGSVHVSGCVKGCASSAPADITLVGMAGGYRMIRNACVRDEGGHFIASAEIPAILSDLPTGDADA